MPVRLASLSLPISKATYLFQGENTVVRESFGVHFFGWDDSTYTGKVGGLALYNTGQEPTSVQWLKKGERLEVEVSLPELIAVGMFDFDKDSIDGSQTGWIARLVNRGGIAEVLMHLEQQVLKPHACGDVASLRDHVNLIETQFATQAKPYKVDVLWRSGGQSYDVPSDSQLLASAC
jgi:hypothetical protein